MVIRRLFSAFASHFPDQAVRTQRSGVTLSCLSAALLVGGFGCGEGPLPTEAVQLRSGEVLPVTLAAVTTQRFVVRLNADVSAVTLAPLKARGAQVEALVDKRGIIATLADRAWLEAPTWSASGVAWVTPLLPAHKISPGLRQLSADVAAASASELENTAAPLARPVLVALDLFSDVDARRFVDVLSARGLNVAGSSALRTNSSTGRVLVKLQSRDLTAELAWLAERDEVLWIGSRGKRVLLNDTSVWVGQSGLDGNQATPIHDHGILGQGQIAGVLDSGADVDHCFFVDEAGLPATNQGWDGRAVEPTRRKVIAYDFMYEGDSADDNAAWDNHGHGTHVCGTVLGDGDTAGSHDGSDGMAPAAKLVMQDGGFTSGDECSEMAGVGCPVVDLKPIFQQAYDQGARVHNNSWGDREEQTDQDTYSQACVDVDEFMWANRDFLLVFAAGNSGPEASTIGSPSTSKNCLSVGATGRASGANKLAGFSSRGPTRDGRIRPDVTFPGSNIVSSESDKDISTNNCGTTQMSGTSMAAPGATGMAVLTRQYFMDGFYPSGAANAADAFVPTAALLKATLINSAVTMDEAVIPSGDQGWGRIQLDRALAFNDGAFELFVVDEGAGFAAATDPAVEWSFNVTGDTRPFKVTLVWTDYPSTTAAATNLVNDLDLQVTTPSGDFLGNVFTDGVSAAGGEADRLNNVEQVLLPTPAAGMYRVKVSPVQIAMGPQPFALVVTGVFESNGGSGGAGGAGAGGSAGAAGSAGTAGTAGAGGVAGTGGAGAGGAAGGAGGAQGGSAGTGGAAGGVGGAAGSAGFAGTGGVGASTGDTGSSDTSGCGCRLTEPAPRSGLGFVGAALALGLAAQRRRRVRG